MRQDLVYALRNLRKSPGYAAITVLTLALGVGANTAIFSVVNGVLLKPLPYPEAERLYFITSQFPGLGFDQFWVSAPEFIEFRDRTQAFAAVGAYRSQAVNLGTDDQPRRVNSAIVTSELMNVLGVPPLRGRTFTYEDTLPGAEPVAILSSELWQSAFGGEASVLGRQLLVNGTQTRVVGIMPPGYDVHDQRILLWEPLTLNPASPGNRGGHFLYLVGRLRAGVTRAQALADVESMLARWPELNPGVHAPNPQGHRLRIDGLQDDMVGGIRTALWVLQGAVAFVLLIACANLANLLLARAESRQKEFAIRTALGAGRLRLLRQFLTEGLVLAVAGGIAGAALGFGALQGMLAANPDSLPRSAEITLDPIVLLFTIVISLATGLIFGFAPLLNLREYVVTLSLKEAGQRATAGSARARVRAGLVMIEVALAVVLVIGAGLLLRSFWNLLTVDPGFSRSRLVTFGLVLPQSTYREPQSVIDFFRRLNERLSAVPGVQGVAAMQGLPPFRNVNANDTDFEGYTAPPEGPFENVDYYQNVTPGYLQTMGIAVVEGRDFVAPDVTGAPVVLINETLAKTFFPGQSPVGRRLKPSFGAEVPWFTIVGVVRDVKQGGVDQKTGTEIYFLADQGPRVVNFAPRSMNVVVRSSLPIESLGGDIRRLVQEMDPTLPVIRLRTMDEVFADTISRPRFLAQLLGIFAGLALALAAIGTYGILSYSVGERRKEIGIHMALGASRRAVLGMVLGQGMRLTLAGLVVGVAAALALTRLLQAQLFNVRPTDPTTMAAVVAAIALVALAACYVPASRAMRVDPMVVLREE
ncbi:MAG TPA: ABC transporter permease [Vicinamibacterales bacterium]|nr:ABC transporter permease [Vicinamibacterales bacterium]